MLFMLYVMGELSNKWIGTDGFEVKRENEKFTAMCPLCPQNLKMGHFKLLFWRVREL